MRTSVFRTPQDFVGARGEGCEAVVVRIGLNDAQLVVVDDNGAWDRWVYHSVDEAATVAEGLGIQVHMDEFPEPLRVRMNAYQRPRESFDAGAYPEQGGVGPVIPYPENRPRRLVAEEAAPDAVGRTEDRSPAPRADS
ncbi:MAG: hypothetical protein ACRDJV_09260 [Actinomycetota bacterium]